MIARFILRAAGSCVRVLLKGGFSMPVTYAHYRFGREALSSMPPELQTLVSQNHPLFDFGIHGPDLLFFHHPLTKNPVKQLGYDSHHRSGGDFFSQAAEVVRCSPHQDAAKSYLLGLLCHYTLDRCCHIAVAEAEKTGLTHAQIEASFDRHLMELDGLEPTTHRTTGHLRPSRAAARIIAPFFPSLSEKTIFSCQKSLIFYMDLIVGGRCKRRLLTAIMTLLGKPHLKHMMVPSPEAKCTASDRQLFLCYEQALTLYSLLLPQLWAHLETGTSLGANFDRTFSWNEYLL